MSEQRKQELPPLGQLGQITREVSDDIVDPKRPIKDGENKIREESEGLTKFKNQKAPGKLEGDHDEGKFEGDYNKGKFEEGKNPDASGKFEGKFESKDKDSLGKSGSADKQGLGKFEGKFESNEKDRLGKFEGDFGNKDKK